MNTIQKALFTVVLSLVLFSCTNNDSVSPAAQTSAVASTYEVVSAAALPSTISTYIASKYAGSTTTEVNLNADGTYVAYVTLAPGATAKMSNVIAKLNFTARGILVSTKTETPVAVSDLLPAIKTYISVNYAGATINVAHSETGGSFDVLITAADGSKIKLDFTADGTFESARVFRINGNHKHNHAGIQTPVAIADLVASITTYITTTYAGATITSAHKESDGSFDVFITTAAGANLNLNFSATGEFVSVSSNGNNDSNHETPVDVADLLAEITTYITTNYAGATITSAEKDWNGGFEVHINTAAGVRLELNFTSTGTFVVGSDSNNNHMSGTVSVIIQDLINNIKTYITNNYAGATIKEAHLESDGSYDVTITTAAGIKLKLNFSATGVFVSVKTV
ncbi:PepSY-like domain-containing protein [Flavobacterium sp.]|uniref:PepSY-like domain-containing protein n=1 Tax=Flavobacterium sp. TaxID=239 RepID=UPI00375118C8